MRERVEVEGRGRRLYFWEKNNITKKKKKKNGGGRRGLGGEIENEDILLGIMMREVNTDVQKS